MSDRYTTISGHGTVGLVLPDRCKRAEAIAEYRKHYQTQLDEARRALELTDDELVVETHLGMYRRRSVKEVTE